MRKEAKVEYRKGHKHRDTGRIDKEQQCARISLWEKELRRERKCLAFGIRKKTALRDYD